MATEEKTLVVVKPGVTVYHGGGIHGFVAGESVPLPNAHADELHEAGHVEFAVDEG